MSVEAIELAAKLAEMNLDEEVKEEAQEEEQVVEEEQEEKSDEEQLYESFRLKVIGKADSLAALTQKELGNRLRTIRDKNNAEEFIEADTLRLFVKRITTEHGTEKLKAQADKKAAAAQKAKKAAPSASSDSVSAKKAPPKKRTGKRRFEGQPTGTVPLAALADIVSKSSAMTEALSKLLSTASRVEVEDD